MSAREVRLRIELTHPGPRCRRDDAECLPISMGGVADPSLDRYPISHSGGDCSHDGECTIGGCVQGCVSWRRAARDWICAASADSPETPSMLRACGCVASQCRWFEQDRPADRGD
jgi:hypothetical protein